MCGRQQLFQPLVCKAVMWAINKKGRNPRREGNSLFCWEGTGDVGENRDQRSQHWPHWPTLPQTVVRNKEQTGLRAGVKNPAGNLQGLGTAAAPHRVTGLCLTKCPGPTVPPMWTWMLKEEPHAKSFLSCLFYLFGGSCSKRVYFLDFIWIKSWPFLEFKCFSVSFGEQPAREPS